MCLVSHQSAETRFDGYEAFKWLRYTGNHGTGDQTVFYGLYQSDDQNPFYDGLQIAQPYTVKADLCQRGLNWGGEHVLSYYVAHRGYWHATRYLETALHSMCTDSGPREHAYRMSLFRVRLYGYGFIGQDHDICATMIRFIEPIALIDQHHMFYWIDAA